jgi:8-oxo-dGTP pyrophosphatase MutT (NUDIX family)
MLARFGGSLQLGETPLAGAASEISEELNYEVKSPEFFRSYTRRANPGVP